LLAIERKDFQKKKPMKGRDIWVKRGSCEKGTGALRFFPGVGTGTGVFFDWGGRGERDGGEKK